MPNEDLAWPESVTVSALCGRLDGPAGAGLDNVADHGPTVDRSDDAPHPSGGGADLCNVVRYQPMAERTGRFRLDLHHGDYCGNAIAALA
jgi:hypothetical protein